LLALFVGISLVLAAPAAVPRDESVPSVEADISSGSYNLPTKGGVLLGFDRPMDQRSVEQGLSLSPPVPFERHWAGSRLRLTWSLNAGEFYVLRLNGARSWRGGTIRDWQLGWTTAPPPTIAGVTLGGAPLVNDQRRVPLRPQIQVQFDRPMDPDIPAVALDNQPLDGAQWDAAGAALTFTPALAAGSRHELKWHPSARSAAGVAPDSPFSLAFWTIAALPSNGHPLDGNPMLVQIEDSGPARPQYGLQQADIVYEYLSEYDISRFTAIYFSEAPAVVGPVRSTRRISVQLREMYRGVLFSSGASNFVLGLVYQSGATYIGNATFMYRDYSRFAPHNLMVSGGALREHRNDFGDGGAEYAVDLSHPDIEWPGATDAGELSVPLHHDFWRYAPELGGYLRWDHGIPFTDAATGQQVRAKNLIVQHVESFLGPEIEDTNGGARGREHVMTGEGQAEYYSNGKMVPGRWRHPDRKSPMEYLDAAGNPMNFNTGLTWVHVVF